MTEAAIDEGFIGERCLLDMEARYSLAGSLPKLASEMGMSKWTLYRIMRRERRVGIDSARALKARLGYSSTDEIFS
jgi:AraC-like DNA-binding protein